MSKLQFYFKQIMKRMKYKQKIKVFILITILLCSMSSGLSKVESSSINMATSSRVNVRIDYLEELAFITPGSGNSTKFYYSENDKKTWELIDTFGVIDISSMLSNKEVVLYFIGNKDVEPTMVTLQQEDNSLKATYQIVNNDGVIMLSNAVFPVEYRKGANGQWKTITTNTLYTAIYEMKGATLYFRNAATASKRAGKTISVKVSKKPAAPSVKIDGSKLLVTGMKSGVTMYRVGDSTNWILFSPSDSRLKTIDLSELLGTSTINNTPTAAGVIEFRNKATVKKVASLVKVLEIPLQPSAPNTVRLTGTTLSIVDTDTKKPYEYTRVERYNTLDMKNAKWTTITSAKTVVIPKASVGDKILVRLKSTTNTDKQITPASLYKEFVVSDISG